MWYTTRQLLMTNRYKYHIFTKCWICLPITKSNNLITCLHIAISVWAGKKNHYIIWLDRGGKCVLCQSKCISRSSLNFSSWHWAFKVIWHNSLVCAHFHYIGFFWYFLNVIEAWSYPTLFFGLLIGSLHYMNIEQKSTYNWQTQKYEHW